MLRKEVLPLPCPPMSESAKRATFVLRGLSAVLVFLGAPAHAQGETGQTFRAKVIEVTDGDTYDVRRPDGQVVTIRLHGVDAPESSQPGGRALPAWRESLEGGEACRSLCRA